MSDDWPRHAKTVLDGITRLEKNVGLLGEKIEQGMIDMRLNYASTKDCEARHERETIARKSAELSSEHRLEAVETAVTEMRISNASQKGTLGAWGKIGFVVLGIAGSIASGVILYMIKGG